MANAVHQSEAIDVHDGIFSTPVGIYSTPCEAPDLHDKICRPLDGKCSTWPLQHTYWQMQYTQVRLLKYAPVLFLMLDDGLCSALDGKCSTPK